MWVISSLLPPKVHSTMQRTSAHAGVNKKNLAAWEKFCQNKYKKVSPSLIHSYFKPGSWEKRTADLVKKKGGALKW